MKIRYVTYAVLAAVFALMVGTANADVITSGSATRVGEPLEADSTVGRSQIKVCGKMTGNPVDLRTCTFELGSEPSSLFVIPIEGSIFEILTPRRGGKATEVSFQTPGSTRPSLTAKFADKNKGELDFCISIDRAVTLAPAGISTEPCVSGETADLLLEFALDCEDGNNFFSQTSTWRVATQCVGDFPNLRTP